MSEWRWTTIGQVTNNFDRLRRPVRSSDRVSGDVPYYGASGIVDWVEGHTHEGTFLLVAEDGENLRSRSVPVAFIARGKSWVNNHAHVLTGNELSDTRYLEYVFATTDLTGYLTGSAQPKLSRAALDAIPVLLPSVATQRAVAEVLGALDDKIAANLRIAAIADELVRAWYTSWAARAPGAMPLSALAEHHRVAVDPASMPPTTPYVGLEHLPRRSMWLPDSAVASGVTSGKSVFSEGDVLFGKLRPYFHKVVGAAADGICSTDILVIRANDPDLRGLVLAAAASDEAVALATASSEGTRMPRTNWKDLATLAVPWHDEASARALSADVRGMWAMTSSKFIENARLASLRDALLPLLVSGKVRVKDAEKVVEGVV